MQAGDRQTLAQAGEVEAIDLQMRLAQPLQRQGRQAGLRRERGLAQHRAGINRQGLEIATEFCVDRQGLVGHNRLQQRVTGHLIGPAVADGAIHRQLAEVAAQSEGVDRPDATVVMQTRRQVAKPRRRACRSSHRCLPRIARGAQDQPGEACLPDVDRDRQSEGLGQWHISIRRLRGHLDFADGKLAHHHCQTQQPEPVE